MPDFTSPCLDCGGPYYARQMCKPCYFRRRKQGTLPPRQPRENPPCAVDGCPRTTRGGGRGWCSKHWARWRKTGDPLVVSTIVGDDRARFFAKVQRTGSDGCWTWIGQVKSDGYGKFGAQGRTWIAHRYAFELLVGPIGEDETGTPYVLDHLCRNTRCVNPAHLDPVTTKVNTRRGGVPNGDVCKKAGHDLTDPANYWIHPTRGYRRCRLCSIERNRVYDAKRGWRRGQAAS